MSIVSKDHLQVLAFFVATFALLPVIVSSDHDPHQSLESLQLGDAATRVLQVLGSGGIHRERGHFRDGIPCRRALTWRNNQLVSRFFFKKKKIDTTR